MSVRSSLRVPGAPALLVAALLWATHAAMIRLVAADQVVARLFAAGTTAGLGTLLLALVFVLVRLVAYTVGPGLVLYGLSRIAVDRIRSRGATSSS